MKLLEIHDDAPLLFSIIQRRLKQGDEVLINYDTKPNIPPEFHRVGRVTEIELEEVPNKFSASLMGKGPHVVISYISDEKKKMVTIPASRMEQRISIRRINHDGRPAWELVNADEAD
jgi:hypothetical protein